LFLRAHGDWLVARSLSESSTPASTWSGLSPLAREVAAYFERRGAAFLAELEPLAQRAGRDEDERLRRVGLDDAIWELVRHGVLASDGFDGLRALLRRRDGKSRVPTRAIGRWSLIHRDARPRGEEEGDLRDGSPVEHAWLYLRRYGVVTRDLLAREVLAPPWRELALVYRRLEARGEIRGGRFVTGLRGEQFALGEALELVAKLSRGAAAAQPESSALESMELAAADPLNLVGILTPGPRWSPLSTERLRVRDGVPQPPEQGASAAV
jgi:ATP-dependent Lhr-like helicase